MHGAETHAPVRGDGHGHDHDHGQDQGQDLGQDLGQDRGHLHAAPARREAGVSLLRLSVAQRLGFVLIAVALIWAGVYWALS
jgi:hypothetical protein